MPATATAKTRHDWLGRAPIIETGVIGAADHVPKRFAEHDYGGSAVGEGRAQLPGRAEMRKLEFCQYFVHLQRKQSALTDDRTCRRSTRSQIGILFSAAAGRPKKARSWSTRSCTRPAEIPAFKCSSCARVWNRLVSSVILDCWHPWRRVGSSGVGCSAATAAAPRCLICSSSTAPHCLCGRPSTRPTPAGASAQPLAG